MSMSESGNLFNLGAQALQGTGEWVDTLVGQPGVVIERIVSTGQASPPGFWYDSARDEWVVLLSGAARLEFEEVGGNVRLREMRPGDYVLIEAHCRHRVAWTHESEPTVWLAVHYAPTEP